MRILVIGSGGREHAICHKFKNSPSVSEVFVAPGNIGMSDVASLVNIQVNEFEALASFVEANKIDLTFIGPEVPLVNGIVDYFNERQLLIFGPTKAAARLEGSKDFAKALMHKYQIPTASYATFTSYDACLKYCLKQAYPIVLKEDGLKAGKGVVIVEDEANLITTLQQIFATDNCVVVEEYLSGPEFSLMALVHGDKVYPLPIAQDHKRAYDQDLGPNTGGMGAYSGVPIISDEVVQEAMDKVMLPITKAMCLEGTPFTGILYGGFMLTENGVKTIEFNVRFGDPETQVILPRLNNDLAQLIIDILNDKPVELSISDDYYLGVVLASKGYPNAYQNGYLIEGLADIDALVFHMGTAFDNGNLFTNGGRVLFISAKGKDLASAQLKAYEEVSKIKCSNLFYRSDIGYRALS